MRTGCPNVLQKSMTAMRWCPALLTSLCLDALENDSLVLSLGKGSLRTCVDLCKLVHSLIHLKSDPGDNQFSVHAKLSEEAVDTHLYPSLTLPPLKGTSSVCFDEWADA